MVEAAAAADSSAMEATAAGGDAGERRAQVDKGALGAMQRSLLVLAVVLAHAGVVQAMLPPPNTTSTTPPQTNSSTTPQSKTTPPPSSSNIKSSSIRRTGPCGEGFVGNSSSACEACSPGKFMSYHGSVRCSGGVGLSSSCPCGSHGPFSGSFSDGPGNYTQDSLLSCVWLVASHYPTDIMIAFSSFDTKSGRDFVTINECSSADCATRRQLARLSGRAVSANTNYTSSTGFLEVVFKSDSRGTVTATYAGFEAAWSMKTMMMTKCLECPFGTYTNVSGSSSCTRCRWDSFQNATGATECVTCDCRDKYHHDCDWYCESKKNKSSKIEVGKAWFQIRALESPYVLFVLGWSGFVLVAGLVAIYCFPDRKRKITVRINTVLFFTWFLYDFTFMSARFHWLLNSEDAQFQTMMIGDSGGDYIWITPKFDYINMSQREQLGCGRVDYGHTGGIFPSIIFPGRPTSLPTSTLLRHAYKDACKVGKLPFLLSADISFQGFSFEEGAYKFSVGLGLIILAMVEIRVFIYFLEVNRKMEEEEEDEDPGTLIKILRLPKFFDPRSVVGGTGGEREAEREAEWGAGESGAATRRQADIAQTGFPARGSSGTDGGMSSGQMVMGSAMGAGAQFGEADVPPPLPPAVIAQTGFPIAHFGSGGFGQPASVGFGTAPLTRNNQAVVYNSLVAPPLPPAASERGWEGVTARMLQRGSGAAAVQITGAAAGSESRCGARCLNSCSCAQLANVDFSAMFRKFACCSASALWKHVIWFVVMIPVVSQQSLVLLLLTHFNTSPVCSKIETPAGMNSQTAMCLTKWAMVVLPLGLLIMLLGSLGIFCFQRYIEAERPDLCCLPCIAVFMLSVAVYALGCLMVGFWMFGGMFLGFYFTFASAHAFWDLALVKCFGVLSATFATAISTHL